MDKPKHKPIISIFGTEEERCKMWAIKNKEAGDGDLSFSDMILRRFGIREVKK